MVAAARDQGLVSARRALPVESRLNVGGVARL